MCTSVDGPITGGAYKQQFTVYPQWCELAPNTGNLFHMTLSGDRYKE